MRSQSLELAHSADPRILLPVTLTSSRTMWVLRLQAKFGLLLVPIQTGQPRETGIPADLQVHPMTCNSSMGVGLTLPGLWITCLTAAWPSVRLPLVKQIISTPPSLPPARH